MGIPKRRTLLWILAALGVLFLARGAIAGWVVSSGVRAVTGLRLQIRRMEVGLFQTRVHARQVLLHNPSGFPERIMADLPELDVELDLPSFLRGRTHLRRLRVNLRQFLVVRDRQGRLNLDSLRPVQKAKEEKRKPQERKKAARPGSFLIDELELEVGKVIYKDYSGGREPSVHEFNVGVQERHRNVSDPTALVALIVSRALLKTSIATLADFDVNALDGYARDLLRFSTEALGEAGDKAAETLKKLLPFGQEQQPTRQ